MSLQKMEPQGAVKTAKSYVDTTGVRKNREDLATEDVEDTSWGIVLLAKVEALEDRVAVIPMLAEKLSKAEETIATLLQAVDCFTAYSASNSEVTASVGSLAVKIDALKTAVTTLATKLDASTVAGLADDHAAVVTPLLA